MSAYFLLGLILLVGGVAGAVESFKQRSGTLVLLSIFVSALGCMVCAAVMVW